MRSLLVFIVAKVTDTINGERIKTFNLNGTVTPALLLLFFQDIKSKVNIF